MVEEDFGQRCWKIELLVISYALGIRRRGLILPVILKEKIDDSNLSPSPQNFYDYGMVG